MWGFFFVDLMCYVILFLPKEYIRQVGKSIIGLGCCPFPDPIFSSITIISKWTMYIFFAPFSDHFIVN